MFVPDLYMSTVLNQIYTIKISTKNNDCLTRLPNKAILHIQSVQYLAVVSLVWQYLRFVHTATCQGSFEKLQENPSQHHVLVA
jgi:hypothetical protein